MSHKYPPVDYDQYLKLDQILSAQSLRSVEFQRPAHDEMLFIITHQAYELWFKQILTEVDSVIQAFSQPTIPDTEMATVINRLNRVTKIIRLLIDQIEIMETMTPLDFLEFRDMLFPASGFQSFQFRMLENKLGLKSDQRLKYNSATYEKSLPQHLQPSIKKLESEATLFDQVNAWLARTPFLNLPDFNFWKAYQTSVTQTFAFEEKIISEHPSLSPADKARNLEILRNSRKVFETLFDPNQYQEAQARGEWRLTYQAVHAALFIQLYRDQPILQQPFELIRALLDIDELMTTWRYRHALMAKRMLGSKIGTGGSSGYEYLKQTSEKHKIFHDFHQLTTFFIPRSQLPDLPESVKTLLGFQFSKN